MPDAQHHTIGLDFGDRISGLWLAPRSARACLVLAHGAGMAHRSMAALADGLAERKIATLRYQFLYMERGTKRPDPAPLAHKAVRAAVAEAARRAGDLPLYAGGRSFGGRMTSQAQAIAPLRQVRGLVFFAFPNAPRICRTPASRCCSCRAPRTRWRMATCCAPWSRRSATAPR